MIKEVFIGKLKIDFPVGLAPLAGVSDAAYRAIAREMGAGVVVSEMVSAQAVNYRNKNTFVLLQSKESERPAGVQLFGNSPEVVEKAVRAIDHLPFDFVDFNMGCPVPKVVKNGEGSALMQNPSLAADIIAAAVSATDKPVTVKIRAGFDSAHLNAPEMAKKLAKAGASAIAVHGRTREQYYSGNADWEIIRKVKEAVSVPVFGNGDVVDGPSAERMLTETGCDGILVGRAAMGNPWVFSEIRAYLCGKPVPPRPTMDEIKEMLLYHARSLIEAKGEYTAIREMRAHAAWYINGVPHAAQLRKSVCQVKTYAELAALMDRS